MPRRVRKGIRKEPRRGIEIGKTLPKLFFNNPRSSIKPRSAPDPKFPLTPKKDKKSSK